MSIFNRGSLDSNPIFNYGDETKNADDRYVNETDNVTTLTNYFKKTENINMNFIYLNLNGNVVYNVPSFESTLYAINDTVNNKIKMRTSLDFENNVNSITIRNLLDPINNQDVSTKAYTDTKLTYPIVSDLNLSNYGIINNPFIKLKHNLNSKGAYIRMRNDVSTDVYQFSYNSTGNNLDMRCILTNDTTTPRHFSVGSYLTDLESETYYENMKVSTRGALTVKPRHATAQDISIQPTVAGPHGFTLMDTALNPVVKISLAEGSLSAKIESIWQVKNSTILFNYNGTVFKNQMCIGHTDQNVIIGSNATNDAADGLACYFNSSIKVNSATAYLLGATAWTSYCDSNLKFEQTVANYDLMYSNFKKIDLYRFKWDPVLGIEDGHSVNFIAQHIQQYYPKSVGKQKFYKNIQVDVQKSRFIEDEKGIVHEEKYTEKETRQELYGEFLTLNPDEINKVNYAVLKVHDNKIEVLEQKVTLLEQDNLIQKNKINDLEIKLLSMEQILNRVKFNLKM